jgi:putative nucleotidyltransferase with HDIG domain
MSNRIDQFIDRISDLPPAPKVLAQLLVELRDANTSSERIVELVSFDAALTARTLQICNSAAMGSSRKIGDIQEAVLRLGFRRILELVAVATGTRTLGKSHKAYAIDEGDLWRHSVVSAVAAQIIADECQHEHSTVVFTAALLHDVGKTVLSQALESNYEIVSESLERTEQSWLATERQLLGVQHAEVGGRLLERWEFPAALVGGVWHHHDPAAAGDQCETAAYVYLGNMIAHFMGQGCGHHPLALQSRSEALEILKLRGDCLPRFMIKTEEQLGKLTLLFN